MPLNIPSGPDAQPSDGAWSNAVRFVHNGMKAAAITALASIAGCDTPSPQLNGSSTMPVVRPDENALPDVKCFAAVTYFSDSEELFDISVRHNPERATTLEVTIEHDGEEIRDLPIQGRSKTSDGTSFRVAPPEGGWKESDNGVYNIVATDGGKKMVISKFRVNITSQKDNSIRVLNCDRFEENLNKSFYWLLYRAQEGDKVDVGDLSRREIVLRSENGKEFRLILEPTMYDDSDTEVKMRAHTQNLPAGSYDVVLKEDIATSKGGKIKAGTIATLQLP